MKEKFTAVISKYIPERSVEYCVDLWTHYRFSFKVTRERKSKLGDYQFHIRKKQHIITVNGSLNRYGFLITFIHEVAHLVHHEQREKHHSPHGREWKQIFRQLMTPMLNEDIFPEDLLARLKAHMENPKASSYGDPRLARIIKKYDQDPDDSVIYLEELDTGEVFSFHGRSYEKIERRRTRCLCRDLKTGRKYLIPEVAMVTKV